MSSGDAEGKRSESPPAGETVDDGAPAQGAPAQRAPAQSAPAGGTAVPPQRAGDRPGSGGIEEAGLAGGSGDLGGGGDLGGDLGGLDEE